MEGPFGALGQIWATAGDVFVRRIRLLPHNHELHIGERAGMPDGRTYHLRRQGAELALQPFQAFCVFNEFIAGDHSPDHRAGGGGAAVKNRAKSIRRGAHEIRIAPEHLIGVWLLTMAAPEGSGINVKLNQMLGNSEGTNTHVRI